jgi:hypothetical protein
MVRGPERVLRRRRWHLAALDDNKPTRMLVPGADNEIAVDHDRLYFAEYGPENRRRYGRCRLQVARSSRAAGQPVSTTLFAANGELYWATPLPPLGGGRSCT